jgi:hypothetical protein
LYSERQIAEKIAVIAEESMAGETQDWVDSYYEALEFFYWEPQHFRTKTPAVVEAKKLAEVAKKSKKVEEVMNRLREMEVTLNHNIKQFFLLAPAAFRHDLFAGLFPQSQLKETFEMEGREFDEKFALKSRMQPDFLFISEGEIVSIEMKIKSKCSVNQVLKYALLGLAVEIKQKARKEHYLVLLGSGNITGQFPQRFKSSDELIVAIKEKELLSRFLAEKPSVFRQEKQRLEQIVENMKVKFLNYKDLTDILIRAAPKETDQSAGAEVYRNLIDGLCSEISRRKLS